MKVAKETIKFIRKIYNTDEFIPLHEPKFIGNEHKYVSSTIDSSFVSSVGKYVDDFESKVTKYTKSKKSVAVSNGTVALYASMYSLGINANDMIITQSLTFIATCNAISQLGAEPVFIDVSMKSLGMCPIALSQFLEDNAELNEDGICVYRDTGQCIKAIIPVHIFGHPVELDEILAVSKKWNIDLIEDAAESLGSFYKGKHTGTFGRFGAISFNGNKILTTGAGGIILSKNKEDGDHLKHITTTAKVPHKYEFIHDQLGFNYRLPNLNAALGCAQLESIDYFLKRKRKLALMYKDFFHDKDVTYFEEPKYAKSNYWLNSIFVEDKESRDAFLSITNDKGIMTRPAWRLMHKLKMFKHCKRDNLKNSEFIESHLVNLPSTPIILDQNDA